MGEEAKVITREKVAGRPKLLVHQTGATFSHCSGCHHPLVARAIAEAIDELNNVMHELSQRIYQTPNQNPYQQAYQQSQQQPNYGAEDEYARQASATKEDDNVVDADYEVY